MLTLQILAGWTVIGTILSALLYKDGYKKNAKFLFLDLTLGPVFFILLLIVVIGFAPMSWG